jgi:demethylmenaquinone methyltransferase/2-methoxy-6-polyprenyl-1,4-benzoquinol methylase
MDDILRQQLAYYRARAHEYDESVQQTGRAAGPNIPGLDQEWAYLIQALHSLSPCEQILELACGTGIWTQELLRVGSSITALDAAPEMLDINRAKLANPCVQYQQADLFDWAPDRTYDLVFFAFWLSHVPPALLNDFLSKVAAAVQPGGRLFIVDEPAGGRHLSGPAEAGNYQTRKLQNGNVFRIVKAYYDPTALTAQLRQLGFSRLEPWTGDYFFYLTGIKTSI